MPLVSAAYLDKVVAERDPLNLAWIASMIHNALGAKPREADYGLAVPFLVFVEDLTWFAQGIRSGSWTYYEATSVDRQTAVLAGLEACAPEGWAARYRFGMEHWRAPEDMVALDRWMDAQDETNTAFLWDLITARRSAFEAMLP